MTLGEFRKLTEHYPDDAEIIIATGINPMMASISDALGKTGYQEFMPALAMANNSHNKDIILEL